MKTLLNFTTTLAILAFSININASRAKAKEVGEFSANFIVTCLSLPGTKIFTLENQTSKAIYVKLYDKNDKLSKTDYKENYRGNVKITPNTIRGICSQYTDLKFQSQKHGSFMSALSSKSCRNCYRTPKNGYAYTFVKTTNGKITMKDSIGVSEQLKKDKTGKKVKFQSFDMYFIKKK